MPFKRGPAYKVFITTEDGGNGGAGVVLTGTNPVASSSFSGGINGTTKGVAPLGSFSNSTQSDHEIKNVEGIDPIWRWEDDPFTVFGQTRPLDNPVRKSWEMTITKKAEDKSFALLNDGARFGVTGSAGTSALFDGLDTMPGSTGYRLYLWDGSTFYVGYHGTITPDGYKETLSPTGVTVQAVTFRGGKWTSSATTSSAAVTGSVSIDQA